jgi:hypothetical protein
MQIAMSSLLGGYQTIFAMHNENHYRHDGYTAKYKKVFLFLITITIRDIIHRPVFLLKLNSTL